MDVALISKWVVQRCAHRLWHEFYCSPVAVAGAGGAILWQPHFKHVQSWQQFFFFASPIDAARAVVTTCRPSFIFIFLPMCCLFFFLVLIVMLPLYAAAVRNSQVRRLDIQGEVCCFCAVPTRLTLLVNAWWFALSSEPYRVGNRTCPLPVSIYVPNNELFYYVTTYCTYACESRWLSDSRICIWTLFEAFMWYGTVQRGFAGAGTGGVTAARRKKHCTTHCTVLRRR